MVYKFHQPRYCHQMIQTFLRMTLKQDHPSFQIDNSNNISSQKIDSHCNYGDNTTVPLKGYYRTGMKEIHLQSNDLSGQTALDPKTLAVTIRTPPRQPPYELSDTPLNSSTLARTITTSTPEEVKSTRRNSKCPCASKDSPPPDRDTSTPKRTEDPPPRSST